MRKIFLYIAFLSGFPFAFVACKKETPSLKNYYATVALSQVLFADVIPLDVYINGNFYDSISAQPGNEITIDVQANEPLDISIYKPGTKELIADTSVTIPRDQLLSFKIANSAALGVGGFISPAPVHSDSVSLQFIGAWNTTLYPYSRLNVEVYSTKAALPANLMASITGIEWGKMDSRALNVYHMNAGKTSGIILYFKLFDPVSGQYLKQKSDGSESFLMMTTTTSFNGNLTLAQIIDSGEESVNKISTKFTIIK